MTEVRKESTIIRFLTRNFPHNNFLYSLFKLIRNILSTTNERTFHVQIGQTDAALFQIYVIRRYKLRFPRLSVSLVAVEVYNFSKIYLHKTVIILKSVRTVRIKG